jgi:DNA polymerase-3 subunit beta
MKIKVPQSTLLKRLELVSKISTKHVTLPVLQCVLIDVQEEKVVLRVTNLEIAIEASLPDAEITETGVIAVPAHTLLQTVQFLTDNSVELAVEDDVLQVSSGKTTTSIKPIPHDEFPTISAVEGSEATLARQSFSLGIKTAAFAASQSSIKPELGSIYIHQKKEHTITLVATDSFRLMEKTVPQKGVVLDESFMVPYKNALELARVCDLLTTDPSLVVNENQCALRFSDGVHITTRLVSGTFPDYESIMPKEFATEVVVLKQDLATSFKKSNVFLNKFKQVRLVITGQSLDVSSQNTEVGAVTDSIAAQVGGEELTLSFNQQYLADPLSHIGDDSLRLQFAGVGRPVVITGMSDNSLRYLVMPMNK